MALFSDTTIPLTTLMLLRILPTCMLLTARVGSGWMVTRCLIVLPMSFSIGIRTWSRIAAPMCSSSIETRTWFRTAAPYPHPQYKRTPGSKW
ncbi:hypothetical protein F4860DRAFT_148047 [Xylaria cubensis]|nr:hypothetical protein F4860DRAFT_148047 [Xylaria cubensis]